MAFEEVLARIMVAHPERQDALLPILHDIQSELGWIPPQAVDMMAEGLNISRAEVHGVISFYHDFRTRPAGRHVIQICRAEACQAVGSDALLAHVQARLGIVEHQTSADGAMTLEPVYCLGNCACAPSCRVDGVIHGRMNHQRVDALLNELLDERVV